ncbi:hypothetical protein [Paenibacillus chitinolyticus]|uniref:hypothetical protein n=1 Tax=Paenibacillus chitinolyticus TaxID=79263 RepID=UPI001C442426|nr:hypothetical protein [Paenibacillus chitinolyticus]MBV6712290.1 hypothetical protein [Paenibacillus chitinolyticus]
MIKARVKELAELLVFSEKYENMEQAEQAIWDLVNGPMDKVRDDIKYKYLISARTYSVAASIAQERGLKRSQWHYVSDPRGRSSAPDGVRTTRDKLIGRFSVQEICSLTGWAESRKVCDEES